MDHDTFQARAARDWQEMENLQTRIQRRGLEDLDHATLERTAAIHRRVVSDFALARSRFPGSAVEARLRRLAFTGHRLLARREAPWLPRLRQFFAVDFRRAYQAAQGPLRVAGAIFLCGVLAGYVITGINPEFARLFLGDDAMDGLRHGELWTDALTTVMPPAVTASSIFTNNLSVALVAFAGGALLGVGTLYVLVFNGLMLGAVLAVTAHHELLGRIFSFIAAHGPLELFLIVVASAAGLTMARGAIAWENRPRALVFREAARAGLHLVGGTLPWFVLLGFVEGFVSPRTEVGLVFKVGLGVLLLVTFLAHVRTRPSEDTP